MRVQNHKEMSTFDYKIAKYIATSLRRYAAKQKYRLHQKSSYETLAIDDQEKHGLNKTTISSPSAEDEYFRAASLLDAIGDYSLYQAIQALTDRQRYLVDQLMVRDARQGEVADTLGITQQAVWRGKEQALRRMRHALGHAKIHSTE